MRGSVLCACVMRKKNKLRGGFPMGSHPGALHRPGFPLNETSYHDCGSKVINAVGVRTHSYKEVSQTTGQKLAALYKYGWGRARQLEGRSVYFSLSSHRLLLLFFVRRSH